METGDHEQDGGRRPATVTEGQTGAQRRQVRQAEVIRDMERMMRSVIAFTRKQD
jgi:hypothetical protein